LVGATGNHYCQFFGTLVKSLRRRWPVPDGHFGAEAGSPT